MVVGESLTSFVGDTCGGTNFSKHPSPRICHAKALFWKSFSLSSATVWVVTAALELLVLSSAARHISRVARRCRRGQYHHAVADQNPLCLRSPDDLPLSQLLSASIGLQLLWRSLCENRLWAPAEEQPYTHQDGRGFEGRLPERRLGASLSLPRPFANIHDLLS